MITEFSSLHINDTAFSYVIEDLLLLRLFLRNTIHDYKTYSFYPVVTKGIMDNLEIQAGQKVLLLWYGQQPSDTMKDTVNVLLQNVGQSGKVQVEHVERLSTCE